MMQDTVKTPMAGQSVSEVYAMNIGEKTATRLCARVDMRDNRDCFSGHFPGVPIFSGVMQLHWVVLLAKQHWYPQGKFSGVSRIKFQCPILPDDVLDIELTNATGGKINYWYKCKDRVMSSGSFLLSLDSAEITTAHV